MYSNIPSFYTLFKEYIDYLFQFFILINYILNRRDFIILNCSNVNLNDIVVIYFVNHCKS